jgi:hypothetical protein
MKSVPGISALPPWAAFFSVVVLLAGIVPPVSARTTGWEPAGPAWYGVTVVHADDRTMTGLKVQWLANGARLRVTRAGGAYRDYFPEEIRALRAADGGDLTATVAAARPGGAGRRDDDPFLGRNREPKIFAQSFDFGVGYAMVLGEWFANDDYGAPVDMDNGLNAHVGFRAGISQRSYLRLAFLHQLANIEPAYEAIDDTTYVPVDLDGTVDELILSVGTALTEARRGSFAVAEIGAGVVSRRITGPDVSDRVFEFAAQVALLSMIPLDDQSAVEFGASLTIKPSAVGPEQTGGALMRAYVGYSFVGW